jgi:hypothetical protein
MSLQQKENELIVIERLREFILNDADRKERLHTRKSEEVVREESRQLKPHPACEETPVAAFEDY